MHLFHSIVIFIDFFLHFRFRVFSNEDTLKTAEMFKQIRGKIPIELYNACLANDNVDTLKQLDMLQPIKWIKLSNKKLPVKCFFYCYIVNEEGFKMAKLDETGKSYIKVLANINEKFKKNGIHDFIDHSMLRDKTVMKYIKSVQKVERGMTHYFSIVKQ